MQNLISASLSNQDYQDVLKAIKTIKSKLPFLLKLDDEEKSSISKMGSHQEAFVEKALQYGKNMPQLLPVLVDIDELKRDLELYKQVNQIFKELKELTDFVDDTRYAVSSDAFTVATTIFNVAKMGAKFGKPDPKLNEIVFELEKLHKGK